jgi:hypothetical protein
MVRNEPMNPEIVVVEQDVTVAHPSYAAGGYIVLTAGASAFRNADLVPRNPKDILAWCRGHGCDVTLLHEDPATRRYRVRFSDQEAFAAFQRHFV